MEEVLKKGDKLLGNVVVANLFFEPSTRTNLSFQAAASRLGAATISAARGSMSAEKGESFIDTIKIVDGYADVIVIRHAMEGSAKLAAEVAEHPVVNAGDGGNQHPTQTLIDLYTIRKIKGEIKGLNVHLVGDLKHARAMRSLLYGLGMFGANVKLVSPANLRMSKDAIDEVKGKFGIKVEESGKIDLKGCDVLYVCRVQAERFMDKYEAERMQREFRVSEEYMKNAKKEMIILHPLPKIDEIPEAVDKSPRAKYFEQAKYGVPVRMAVIMELLEGRV